MTSNFSHLQLDEKGRIGRDSFPYIEDFVNASQNPVTYLSIDPGSSTGICGYDKKLYLQFMFRIAGDDVNKFIYMFHNIETCIYEGYKIYPNKTKQHAYSDVEALRVIGRIESWAEIKNIKLVKQPASIKPTGYKWVGSKPLPKSNPKNDALDAHIHFIYWAVTKGLLKAEELLKLGSTDTHN